MKDFKDDGYIDTVYEIVKQYIKKSKVDVISRYIVVQLVGVCGLQELRERGLLIEHNPLGITHLCYGYTLVNKSNQWHKPTPDELEELFKKDNN